MRIQICCTVLLNASNQILKKKIRKIILYIIAIARNKNISDKKIMKILYLKEFFCFQLFYKFFLLELFICIYFILFHNFIFIFLSFVLFCFVFNFFFFLFIIPVFMRGYYFLYVQYVLTQLHCTVISLRPLLLQYTAALSL